MSNPYITPFDGKVWIRPEADHPRQACIKLRGPAELTRRWSCSRMG